ncbi:rhodanese-like domain-containing protein [Maridesulfovibrio sp.]|uniref:rhodanese-like domain-containing protein n=1 Tax=Maridesulfovibrio sp. TaxID=2795000 RepID=UPI002A18D29E|nr:rhodanese-like domain-containing protein [Maridesulfovibrio sp.]
MQFFKKTAWLLKFVFLVALSACLAFGFNMVRPHAYTMQELTNPQPAEVTEISISELMEAFDKGGIQLVDARSDTDFAMGHIPGAINIPYWAIHEELAESSSQLDREGVVVVYCDGLSCGKSRTVAKKLVETGFRKVKVYSDGIDGWISFGRDLEAN